MIAPERVLFESTAFRGKLFRAMALCSMALVRYRRPYIAFSCGKDSLVVAALVGRVCLMEGKPQPALVWSDEELILPETLDYMRRLQMVTDHSDLIIVAEPDMHGGWFRAWSMPPYWREPVPGTIMLSHGSDGYGPGYSATDAWMAEQGYDMVFTGLRMEESRRRRDWLAIAYLTGNGVTYGSRSGTGRRCCPIWDWTVDDVWALIAGWGLPYNTAYDVYERIGVPRARQRIGPLPLSPREHLAEGWPDILARLEARYGNHWR